MGSNGRPVGPRGAALLAVAAVVGIVLAVHGWSGRHSGLASPPSASRGSPAARPGPLLSSEPFAGYAYLVWPGPPGAAARAALTGLSVSVRRADAGISVTAGVNGQRAAAPRFYPGGTRVYVVEASLGDDSGNSDYNLADDALVVTDAQQRILP